MFSRRSFFNKISGAVVGLAGAGAVAVHLRPNNKPVPEINKLDPVTIEHFDRLYNECMIGGAYSRGNDGFSTHKPQYYFVPLQKRT